MCFFILFLSLSLSLFPDSLTSHQRFVNRRAQVIHRVWKPSTIEVLAFWPSLNVSYFGGCIVWLQLFDLTFCILLIQSLKTQVHVWVMFFTRHRRLAWLMTERAVGEIKTVGGRDINKDKAWWEGYGRECRGVLKKDKGEGGNQWGGSDQMLSSQCRTVKRGLHQNCTL